MMDEQEQQQALLDAARISLVGQVMTEWLGLTHDQHTINIEELRLVNLETNELYIMQRYRNGIGTLEDLDSARTSTSVSRASPVAYKDLLPSISLGSTLKDIGGSPQSLLLTDPVWAPG